VRAVDTNVLVYAKMSSLPQHGRAKQLLKQLAEGTQSWAIPWPCIYEFLRVVTHPRVFHPPVTIEEAVADVEALLLSPSLTLLGETPRHASFWDRALQQPRAAGNLVHDAHIAALCMEHGVSELLTSDRDFARFPGVRVTDPFRS